MVLKFQGVPESTEGGKEAARSGRSISDSRGSEGAIVCSAEIKFAIIFMIARGVTGQALKRVRQSSRDNLLPVGAGGTCV